MVTGLRFRFAHQELLTHLNERTEHHNKRAETKQAQLPKLKQMLEDIKNNRFNPSEAPDPNDEDLCQTIATYNKSPYAFNSESPVEQLERDIAAHQKKARTFRLLAEHLFEEYYDLAESDLKQLEMV